MEEMTAPRSFMGHPVIECLPGTLTPRVGGGATEQRGDVGGVYFTTATVDPLSHTAITALTLAVTIAGILTTDQVIAMPPVTLEAGIVCQSVTITAVNSVNVRTTNASSSTIDPASATWGFLVFRR